MKSAAPSSGSSSRTRTPSMSISQKLVSRAGIEISQATCSMRRIAPARDQLQGVRESRRDRVTRLPDALRAAREVDDQGGPSDAGDGAREQPRAGGRGG